MWTLLFATLARAIDIESDQSTLPQLTHDKSPSLFGWKERQSSECTPVVTWSAIFT